MGEQVQGRKGQGGRTIPVPPVVRTGAPSRWVEADRLTAFLIAVVEAVGTPPDIAPAPAEGLVRANLSGYDSHGVVHIDHYLHEVDEGIVVPNGRPKIVSERASSFVVDACGGWGHFAGGFAMDLAMKAAAQTGVAAVSVKRCPHIGRLGQYVEDAASRGFISMVTWGAGKAGAHLAVPFGGAEPALSTNPFAFGVPTGDDRPFVVDYATTVIANAKAWICRDRGEPLPEGACLDRHGNPTTDPEEYINGGMLKIFGEHKGYGISLITCLLGALSGNVQPEEGSVEGPFFLAIDPEAFLPRDDFQVAARAFLDGVKATPPSPGFEEVLVPGDFEVRARAARAATGIELTDGTQAVLRAAAAKVGIAFDLLDDAPTAPFSVDY